ncbi:hypothetical protein SS1G_07760 [Sclerotinia sclerotiorum 1980 UF-70]|uniref:Uncharacterized protein n=1 Tax=Sclerotinia sclerotiorum (strain ATCC 18683 / 1980 / Ss-1) TaxID=665079 RepID=A7ER07_SCLS1|nr:hypothetical protein SS1G_07760 [Sclerotinia sclerotiorum 1980 UF-70]EDN91899.1 hypothetical protein SS1G_07760 [Sclerotinia sclerotiorum 1980 UF-70]
MAKNRAPKNRGRNRIANDANVTIAMPRNLGILIAGKMQAPSRYANIAGA